MSSWLINRWAHVQILNAIYLSWKSSWLLPWINRLPNFWIFLVLIKNISWNFSWADLGSWLTNILLVLRTNIRTVSSYLRSPYWLFSFLLLSSKRCLQLLFHNNGLTTFLIILVYIWIYLKLSPILVSSVWLIRCRTHWLLFWHQLIRYVFLRSLKLVCRHLKSILGAKCSSLKWRTFKFLWI